MRDPAVTKHDIVKRGGSARDEAVPIMVLQSYNVDCRQFELTDNIVGFRNCLRTLFFCVIQ